MWNLLELKILKRLFDDGDIKEVNKRIRFMSQNLTISAYYG
jgi:hypothetical protein